MIDRIKFQSLEAKTPAQRRREVAEQVQRGEFQPFVTSDESLATPLDGARSAP